MADGVFVPDVLSWEREFKLPGGMVERHIAKIAHGTATNARFTAPSRTGLMRSTIRAVPTGGTDWNVTVGTKYGLFQHEGTGIHGGRGPYAIFPKKPGGWLRWYSGTSGKPIFARKVLHPGVPATKFLWKALGRMMDLHTRL